MDLSLSAEQRDLCRVVGALLTKACSTSRVRAVEADGGFDADLWGSFSAIGVVGKDFDDAPDPLLTVGLIAEICGRHLAPVPLIETYVGRRLLSMVSAESLVPRSDEAVIAVALAPWQSRDHEVLVQYSGVADGAVGLLGDELLWLTGMDCYPEQRNFAGAALNRVSPKRATEIEVLQKGGAARAAYAEMVTNWKRLAASVLVGMGLQAVELAAEFAKQRSAFGVPIGRFQAVAFPLADDLTALDGARLLSWKSQWAAEKQLDSAGLLALMAYASAAEAASRAVAHALHTHGGHGLTEECDIQLYHRRTKFLAVIAGDPKHQYEAVADALLPQYEAVP
ncbi:MAG: acyl-CoA dehydrogenase family protein [Mycobacterium sp.]